MKLFILAFSLLIAFFASAQTGKTKVKWLTHTDSVYNLTIDYPSDWQLKPSTQKACFFVTSYPESDKDNFRENLNCIIPKDINKGTTIQMVEKEIVNTLSQSFSDFKIVHSGYLEWNNVSAYEIEYTYTETSNNVKSYLHMLQKMAIIKGKFYTLTYTSMSDSYEKYISTIRKIFQSFKVL